MCTAHEAALAAESRASQVDRRGFLRTAAAVGAAGALGAAATAALTATPAMGAPTSADAASRAGGGGHGRHRVPPESISVQLYTLRDQLAIDLEGTLAALRQIGYRKVEHAGFVGRTVQEFKAALDAAGLWSSSGHSGIPQPFNASAWSQSLADARVLRSKYIVHPFFGINFGTGEVVRDRPTWTAFAHDLNRAGRMARDAGLRLGYHNHNWEFFRLTDDPSHTAYDVLLEETDPRYVHLELDLFWAWRGAADPVDILRRVEGRVRQYHVKDLNQGGSFEDPGVGLIDFVRIFREHVVDEFIVERDDAGTPPRQPADALSTAQVGYRFLSTVRF